MYTESTWKDGASQAVLYKDNIQGTNCFSFWYYMYGESVQNLTAATRTNTSTSAAIFFRAGTQGDHWHPAQLTVQDDDSYQVSYGMAK